MRGGMGGTSPSKFRVWVNRDDVDFSNANELPPIQECLSHTADISELIVIIVKCVMNGVGL